MGTLAFPDLRKNCTVEDCMQLDFSPFTCDYCHKEFCLEHRKHDKHRCPEAHKGEAIVVICPLCTQGVRLAPGQDPNITWESHVNNECDPYDKATEKNKCPVLGCTEILNISNAVKCRDCTLDHCLNHRFGLDHNCHGPIETTNFLCRSARLVDSKLNVIAQSARLLPSRCAMSLLNAASTVRATAQDGIKRLSNELTQKLRIGTTNSSNTENAGRQNEQCPRCDATLFSITELLEHVENVHERSGHGVNLTMYFCPHCSTGFSDPVALVEHVERDHGRRT